MTNTNNTTEQIGKSAMIQNTMEFVAKAIKSIEDGTEANSPDHACWHTYKNVSIEIQDESLVISWIPKETNHLEAMRVYNICARFCERNYMELTSAKVGDRYDAYEYTFKMSN